MHEKLIEIKLSGDEALVLFEFVSRFSDDGALSIVDQAEERVLWNICCALEGHLVTPLNNQNYKQDVEAARSKVRDQVDD